MWPTLQILHVPTASWFVVFALSIDNAPWYQALQPSCERELWFENLRLRSCARNQWPIGRSFCRARRFFPRAANHVCGHKMVSSTRSDPLWVWVRWRNRPLGCRLRLRRTNRTTASANRKKSLKSNPDHTAISRQAELGRSGPIWCLGPQLSYQQRDEAGNYWERFTDQYMEAKVPAGQWACTWSFEQVALFQCEEENHCKRGHITRVFQGDYHAWDATSCASEVQLGLGV